jgi:hypothetical protein
MTTANEFFEEKPKTSILLCANFGEGKTSVMITFPKFMYIGFRQGGLDVLKQDKNKQHRANLVRYETLIPQSDEELKTFFQPKTGKFSVLMQEAQDMAKKGEIESLLIDDFTDSVDNEQKFVWTHQKATTQTGQPDTQSMYGQVKINLSNRLDREILPFRKYGNLLVACHLMREAEQTLEGTKTRAGALDKNSDVYPDIVGSFRREIQRKFENVLYMETKLDATGGRKYKAYTCKQQAMGTIILAKNIMGLDPVIENVNYETIFKTKTTTK